MSEAVTLATKYDFYLSVIKSIGSTVVQSNF